MLMEWVLVFWLKGEGPLLTHPSPVIIVSQNAEFCLKGLNVLKANYGSDFQAMCIQRLKE